MVDLSPVPQPDCLSILLVDDDSMVREATAWMLADAGHRVHQAVDGVAALEHMMDGAHVDLLITDINMPRMNGLSLVKHVQQRWPTLPVLLVSARLQPQGTYAYMSKPFGWHALKTAVANVAHPPSDGQSPPGAPNR